MKLTCISAANVETACQTNGSVCIGEGVRELAQTEYPEATPAEPLN